MKKQLFVGAAVASLIAGSALAQSTNNMGKSGNSTVNKTDSSTMNNDTSTSSTMKNSNTSASAGSGFTMAANASGPVKYQNSGSSELMTSKLVGTNVYNNENQNVGEIKDIALEGSKVTGVVVSVGGFLGMGTEYVLVDPASIALQNDNGTWKAHINTSKEDLKSAPKFTYNESKANKG